MSHHVAPQHKPPEVNSAARALVSSDVEGSAPDPDALAVVNNWRSAHDYPLNGIHMTMKGRAERILGKRALSAQRIKRLESILAKLQDRDTMKLSQMQDIGGCRVILPSVKDVYTLRDVYSDAPVVHEQLSSKDYIAEPNPESGYRSLHLKFRFRGRGPSQPWDGLKIEMQIRTTLQHQWATAVEAAGTLKDQALKSRRGDPEWLRFFRLVSSAFAHREKTELVPSAPTEHADLLNEIRAMDAEHHFVSTLEQYAAIIPTIKKTANAAYYVLKLDPLRLEVTISEFQKHEAAISVQYLEELEQECPRPVQVVRVAVASLKELERAYPNYFLDTRVFLREVRGLIRPAVTRRVARMADLGAGK